MDDCRRVVSDGVGGIIAFSLVALMAYILTEPEQRPQAQHRLDRGDPPTTNSDPLRSSDAIRLLRQRCHLKDSGRLPVSSMPAAGASTD